MGKVLVTRQLPDGGLDPLTAAGHEIVWGAADDTPLAVADLAARAAEADAVVCLLTDRFDADAIHTASASGRLRVIANVAVGYDNIDVHAASRAGVAVCNTPGILDETTADLAFALMLAAARLMGDAERDLRAGRWPGWGVGQYLGQDVHGATLGLIGYGRIGRAVARRATGFGMRVLHHTRKPTGEAGHVPLLDDLLTEADIISVHVPLTEETHHLLDARAIARLKPTAVVVNTARGPVVDEEALAEALECGALFAAGLDVFEREPAVHPRLLAAPRTVLLPHVGSASVGTRTRMARLACDGVVAILAGRRPANLVEIGRS